ncbi:MAG: hypothetical protein US28_C0007G0057 [Candidatus Daviesbacteria bacterium GW2011_GWA1_36_8]|uniref:SbsA Ig-like domain-containing protein n=3 Tax=Candidatus Daviesiibacteriota TaxID=1752718 RepID=A0A0G0ENC5_9BACT|nr:MAG: hypothetical protein US19_C0023G0004 [Candidatus Daviesbacteria bacterium GW2011_GWB1_36_5]KKQ15966.1 MAG: hypothetical protein US28_C0007G0057 [Candidatus Daviesbacteria bacterium GW2011_GWA1_36_8]
MIVHFILLEDLVGYNKIMPRYILIGLVLIIIVFGVVLFFRRGTGQIQTPPEITQPGEVNITSTIPSDNQQQVGIFSDISVSFSTPLNQRDQGFVKLSSNPEFSGVSRWSNDGRIFTLTPSFPLKANQKYQISISHLGKTHEFSFSTSSQQIISTEDQIKEQAAADRNYAEGIKEIDATYPWLNKLPIQATNYFVSFDTNTKKFTAKLYPQTNSSTSIEAQNEQFKKEVLDKLGALEIPYTQYTIDYISTPE